jgi:hypothetical protein
MGLDLFSALSTQNINFHHLHLVFPLSQRVSQFFNHCDKIPDTNDLKGKKIYFGTQLQRFHFTVSWVLCFWKDPETWQGRAKLFTSWQPESRERQGEKPGTRYTLQKHVPMTPTHTQIVRSV